ncbi:SDR family NAD(P)-dependent oxidoreductase [Cryptosporangium aurantiacum]|uniref:Short chain dehydrogenase n=1 Tax=Cryptosporangium aurantiacum TaxID=134849 RepID=A0A1M7MHN7_9ACTN|nr:SDR family NAD(P)-dependent oxidoreductase [Cryptosporangium aurantiacum]SHM89948.1 short chain dehydrogenase [Cryptosporangium aurantiacum]
MTTVGVRAVLVTGAGSTTGRSVITALVGEGHQVCAADSDSDVVQALVDGPGPGVVLGVAGSGRDPDHQDDTVDYALAAFERIDALVNIVSTDRHGPMGVPSGWIYRVQLAWMAERGGSITNVYPVDGTNVDTVAALVSVSTREIAVRLGPRTRVTSVVAPTDAAGPGAQVGGLRALPTRRSSELAGLVLHLISSGTSEFTGRTLVARPTGGWSAVDGDPVVF